MKNKSTILFLILLVSSVQNTIAENKNAKNEDISTMSITINPVKIVGNVELANYAISGFGNSTHPYILNFYINTGYDRPLTAISINDTSAYFIMKNTTVIGAMYGISFKNVLNGIIENSTIHDNILGGILFDRVEYSSIHNCSIYNNGGYGISLIGSENNNFYDNFIFDHQGVSGKNLILTQGDGGGGILFDPSNYNNFWNNNIYNNAAYGIYGFDSLSVNITKNNIFENGIGGVLLENIDDSSVINNKIYLQRQFGIFLKDSNSNNISLNEIAFNTLGYNYNTVSLSQGDGGRGILFDPSDHNNFIANQIYGFEIGIYGENSVDAIIKGNNLTNNIIGISLHSVFDSKIIDNSIAIGEIGILLISSNDIVIDSNTFSDLKIQLKVEDYLTMESIPEYLFTTIITDVDTGSIDSPISFNYLIILGIILPIIKRKYKSKY